MDAFGTAPMGYGRAWPLVDNSRVIVVKVKYGDTLKRFNARVNGSHLDHDLPAIRLKIANAFKFNLDAESILTYTDEDGDVVMLDDDNDLRDAAINQKLNPLRINVQLKSRNVGATQTKQQATNSGLSEAGLRGVVLYEDPNAKIEQVQSCPSVKDSLVFTSSGGMKGDQKRSLDSESKMKSDAHSKGKSVLSSWPPVSTPSHGAPAQGSVPVPFTSLGSIGMASGDMQALFPPPPVPTPVLYPPTPFLTPFNPISGANGKTAGDLHSAFPPPPNIYSPIKLNTPSSSVGTCCTNVYSTGTSHKDRAGSLSSYVPNSEGVNSFGSSYRGLGTNYRGIPLKYAQHRWIQCDGCGVTPIVGPRYKSNIEEDYDLCDVCFSRMGNEVEYTRLDDPASKSNMKILGKVPAVKTDSCFIKDFTGSKSNTKILGTVPAVKPDSCFIKDVTVPDGTPMTPSTPFTKIWRMRNNGPCKWPYGTQLLWVGGARLTCLSSFRLVISEIGGLNPCKDTDVTVDFLAPAKPGRYISYWRLALPSGLTFGQKIWVHIEVEQPMQTSGGKQAAAINLNQIPEANSTRPFAFNINSAPVNFLSGWLGRLECETMEPKESEPIPSDMSSAPAAVEPLQIPVTDAPTSSAEAALASMPAVVPAPEATLLPKPVPVPTPVSASTPAPVAAPLSVPVVASKPAEVLNLLEEKMMSELEVLGFMQADLNKQILRQNNYDLEQSVVDLCGFNEWDPLVGLSDLGSDDTVMSEEVVVVDNSDDEGFIVADLMTKAKKDQ